MKSLSRMLDAQAVCGVWSRKMTGAVSFENAIMVSSRISDMRCSEGWFRAVRRAVLAGSMACGTSVCDSGIAHAAPADAPAVCGHLTAPELKEASGLAASRRHRGVFWSITDSGGLPRLFAVDATGANRGEYDLAGVLNVDWESVAADDSGKLYVGDVGNNTGLLPVRWVYVVDEPSASATAVSPDAAVPALTVARTIAFKFAGETLPPDVEASFIHADNLMLLSKVRKPEQQQPATLFRLSLATEGEPIRTAQPVATIDGLGRVTGADLSADGKRLAVCGHAFAVCIDLDPAAPWVGLSERPRKVVRFADSNVEGCAWDGATLLLVGEDRDVFRVTFPAP